VELSHWVKTSPARILSLTISRNGAVVYELYSAGVNPDAAHYLMSVTKSVTSALVGAAIQRGAIAGTDRSIADLLPRKLFNENSFESFKRLTLKSVMGMSALDAQVPPHLVNKDTKQRQSQFFKAHNRVEFALTQKLLPHVGDQFQYTDITPYLAGGAVQYAVRERLMDFANTALFRPMDFRNSEWMHTDAAGIDNPSYGLRLRPIDMQKFGILYLNQGCWNKSQLLPSEWIRQSFMPWIRNHPTNSLPNYGWFWWTNWRPDGWTEHQANGWKGQRISVFPEKQIVVTMTGIIEDGSEDHVYEHIIKNFVIPSVTSAENDRGSTAELKAALLEVKQQKNALSAPAEYRMIPSSTSKDPKIPFRP
jgi:CubicO group peptidase (beta-lactamase class C family)